MKRERKVLDTKGKKVAVILIVILLLIVVITVACKFILKKDIGVGDNPQLSDKPNASDNLSEENGALDKNENYIILEDGTKEIVNSNVTKKEVNIDGVKLYGFEIKEKDGNTFIETVIENTTQEEIPERLIKIELYEGENFIIDYEVAIPSIKPKESQNITTNITYDCSSVTDIKVKLADTNNSEDYN